MMHDTVVASPRPAAALWVVSGVNCLLSHTNQAPLPQTLRLSTQAQKISYSLCPASCPPRADQHDSRCHKPVLLTLEFFSKNSRPITPMRDILKDAKEDRQSSLIANLSGRDEGCRHIYSVAFASSTTPLRPKWSLIT